MYTDADLDPTAFDEIDLAYEADCLEAQRLGLSLADYLAYRDDMAVIILPFPSPEQVADDARRFAA
jgi:hypothetical protein